MHNYGRFGALLGTIYIGHSHCKFLVYAARNAEVLTCHEIALKEINAQAHWVEIDPLDIWQNVLECIQVAVQNLVILDINPDDIVALAITNRRDTTVLWHKTTGRPLYNAIAWNDCRTSQIIERILSENRNKINLLKSICGLPFSNCFSSLKCRWLIENVPSIKEATQKGECYFGTLETYILWNLTGGLDDGVHLTDVTNASRTMLMNLETLDWDANLCRFFQIPTAILPQIRSCAEIFGYVYEGPLKGIPVAACMTEQAGFLLGQMCTKTQQIACHLDDGCSLLINTGQEIIDSENGLLTTVAFQLGPKQKPVYALEGAVAYAGSAVNWLKENLSVKDEMTSNSQTLGNGGASLVQTYIGESSVLSTYSSGSNFGTLTAIDSSHPFTNVIFVPAFSGLHCPYWKHNSSGLFFGINNRTTAYQVMVSAYEAICYQTRDLIVAFVKDVPSWKPIERLTVGGEFSENSFLLQLLADLCGIRIERPQTSFSACLGAMIAAGLAIDILHLDNLTAMYAPPVEIVSPTMCEKTKNAKYRTWKFAVSKCIAWQGTQYDNSFKDFMYEDKDPDIQVRCSIPGSIYLISSIALVLITKYFHGSS